MQMRAASVVSSVNTHAGVPWRHGVAHMMITNPFSAEEAGWDGLLRAHGLHQLKAAVQNIQLPSLELDVGIL